MLQETPILIYVPSEHNTNLPATSAAVQKLYYEAFCSLTTNNWTKVVPVELLVENVETVYRTMAYPDADLQMIRLRANDLDEFYGNRMHFYDWIGFLLNFYHGLLGSPGNFPVRAVLQKIAQHWPLNMPVAQIVTLKGLASHLVEEKGSRDLIERELACLFLRPAPVPGQAVVHLPSGIGGVITSLATNEYVYWKADGSFCEEKESITALLPVMPALLPRATPLIMPPLVLENIITELRACYPFDTPPNQNSSGLDPVNPPPKRKRAP